MESEHNGEFDLQMNECVPHIPDTPYCVQAET